MGGGGQEEGGGREGKPLSGSAPYHLYCFIKDSGSGGGWLVERNITLIGIIHQYFTALLNESR